MQRSRRALLQRRALKKDICGRNRLYKVSLSLVVLLWGLVFLLNIWIGRSDGYKGLLKLEFLNTFLLFFNFNVGCSSDFLWVFELGAKPISCNINIKFFLLYCPLIHSPWCYSTTPFNFMVILPSYTLSMMLLYAIQGHIPLKLLK